MKTLRQLAAVVFALLIVAIPFAPLAFAQSPAAPAPVAVPVVPAPEPIGANTTTLVGGGALLAIWEVVRRIVLPLIFPSNPSPGPAPGPTPGPTPGPVPVPTPSNPLFDLLRMILERLLLPQPQMAPVQMQAVSGMSGAAYVQPSAVSGELLKPVPAPEWAVSMLEEIRSLRAKTA